MRKRIVPLADIQVRNAKPKESDYKLSDGSGLYLLVNTTGGKLWRLDYSFAGKRKTLSFGSYPTLSLADARQRREDAKKLLSNGVDPQEVKKSLKAATVAATENSFEVVAREWHSKFSGTWSEDHAATTLRRLEANVFPFMGARPINDIKAPEVLAILRRIESRGALETAHRVRTICGQVLRYAVATGRGERDCTGDLKGALPPYTKGHHAAIVDPKDLAPMLRSSESYSGTFIVKSALQLAPLFFLRPGELRKAEWSEFDLDAQEWNIPIERMKLLTKTKLERKGQFHLVPLSRQAVSILRELYSLTGRSKYVFPCARSLARPMSNNAINAALRRMGYDKDTQTGHGFRATARTILDEVLQFRPDIIECQLAHAVKDANGRAYNRTSFLPDRRKMMQKWSDYLDGLKIGAKVIPFKSQAS